MSEYTDEVAAAMKAMGCVDGYGPFGIQCTTHLRKWTDRGCPVAVSVAAAVVASCEGRHKTEATTEVFEVIERFDGRRAMEHVHLTAQAALDWIENGVSAENHHKYRAQSVAVYRSNERTDDE